MDAIKGQVSLAEQVVQLEVDNGHLAVWALGQHGFLLKGGDTIVLIDPYLSNYVEELDPAVKRQVPIVITPDALSMVDVVLITHHHADHCDPRTIAPLLKAAPNARIWGSYTARDELAQQGIDTERFAVPSVDQRIVHNDELALTAIPAAHYEHEPDAAGNPAYLGFIVTLNGVTLYHSGDTVIYDGMIERLQAQPIDLMILPINGRDWFREQQRLVGNMDYREAAELTARVGAKVLLPAHNDMFSANRINPAYLLDYLTTNHPQQRVHFLQAGELYYYVS